MNDQENEEQEKNRIENEFQGFSTFDEVEDRTLKAYNRCVMLFNIRETHSEELAERYAEQISEEERFHMFLMFNYVQERGLEVVKRELSRGEINIMSDEEVALDEAANATIN